MKTFPPKSLLCILVYIPILKWMRCPLVFRYTSTKRRGSDVQRKLHFGISIGKINFFEKN
jgi:hypothetical protein